MSTAPKLLMVDDFLQTYAGPKAELVDGAVQVMPPPRSSHSRTQISIAKVLSQSWDDDGALPGGWWLATEVGVQYGSRNLFCHDLAGWRRERLFAWPEENTVITLTPDWVCEVLSTNVQNDRVHKIAVLHEWRVPHYWVVDPVDKKIRIWEWDEKKYKAILDVDTSFVGSLPPFEGADVQVRRLFGIRGT
jgi:Uma2 family endonuclease